MMMKQAKVLSQKDISRVLKMLAGQRYSQRNRAIFLTSVYTGMRVGEIAALRFEDVIDDTGAVRDEIRLSGAQTKGRSGRVVYLGHRAKRTLSEYVSTIVSRDPQSAFFLSQRTARDFAPNALCQLMNGWFTEAGLLGATSHSGRRTFITELANKGVSPHVLMALAGHKHLATTQRYIENRPSLLHAAVNLV